MNVSDLVVLAHDCCLRHTHIAISELGLGKLAEHMYLALVDCRAQLQSCMVFAGVLPRASAAGLAEFAPSLEFAPGEGRLYRQTSRYVEVSAGVVSFLPTF